MDLEIFALTEDFENLSPRVDLEIFALPDFHYNSDTYYFLWIFVSEPHCNPARSNENSSRVALSHILILPCCHSKCSYIVVIIESTLTRGSPNTATFTWWDLGRLGDRGTDHRGIFTRKHDRSCLDMSEADGVDGGAICKRGFIHLQFAAKPEVPEAERHLGSRILE
ncbi:hypothetical protein V1477_020451 [Vespula maculifrons]|uniref:Uncharacterized protein n=1 Tax=Vespula maculifrons TaxID=7453 RepID=A0ABD2ALZ1_VESMC